MNQKDACGLTPAVSKVSSGALEFLPLFTVKFVGKFLEDVKSPKYGFRIISTNIDDQGASETKEIDEEEESSMYDEEKVDQKEFLENLYNNKKFVDKDLPKLNT